MFPFVPNTTNYPQQHKLTNIMESWAFDVVDVVFFNGQEYSTICNHTSIFREIAGSKSVELR